MAGRVAVQALFVESDGSREPSTQNWSDNQVAAVRHQLSAALEWWRVRLPNARLSFDLNVKVVPSAYEPIVHSLSTEGQWIGDTLTRMGVAGNGYFDQAYVAADRLRRERGADWATTIFVVNSAGVPGGRFADNRFAYAYINGPFMVVTSDAGPYGADQIAPIVAHELGHIFGALDQYAAAQTSCTQRSGYLSVPSTNSQADNCGTRFPSIMLEPVPAYANGQIDASALGQLGYRDSDGDRLPDPIDTAPALAFQLAQPTAGERPLVAGQAFEQPYPSPSDEPMTINTIARAEYRIDGGVWIALAPKDGAYNSAREEVGAILPLYDGQHTIDLRAINSVGVVSPMQTVVVDVHGVGVAPAYDLSVPALASEPAIIVRASAPDGAAVQMSEDPFFAGASWLPAQPSMSWRLSPSEGVHMLYVRFRDAGGLESPPMARAVLLDQTPPTGYAIRHDGEASWLEILAIDNGSGVEAVQVVAGDSATGVWEPFKSQFPLDAAAQQLQVRLRDGAGNVSAPLVVSSQKPVYLPLVAG
jgi:hypothetical protein